MMPHKAMKGKVYPTFAVGSTFLATIMGGGFATGREVVEYFTRFGAMGIYGIIVATILFVFWCTLSVEFARVTKCFDYMSFITRLYEPAEKFRMAFEITYVVMLLMVIAVVLSGGAEVLEELLALPYLGSLFIMFVITMSVVTFGAKFVRISLSALAIVVICIVLGLLVTTATNVIPTASIVTSQGISEPGALVGGIKYADYNLVVLPSIISIAEVIRTRRMAIASGIIGGFSTGGILSCIYFMTLGFYPTIKGVPVPLLHVAEYGGPPGATYVYSVMLFIALIAPTVGMTHALCRRIDTYFESSEVKLPGVLRRAEQRRVLTAFVILLASTGLATFGIIELVAKGYGTMAWIFLALYGLPLAIIGIYKIALVQNVVGDK